MVVEECVYDMGYQIVRRPQIVVEKRGVIARMVKDNGCYCNYEIYLGILARTTKLL